MSRRSERMSKLIQREISALLECVVNDPRLSQFISVTGVSLSPDLKYAKIFVSTFGNEVSREDMLTGFDRASGFLRRELSSRLKLRHMPQLSFYYDDSIERGTRLLELIGQVNTIE